MEKSLLACLTLLLILSWNKVDAEGWGGNLFNFWKQTTKNPHDLLGNLKPEMLPISNDSQYSMTNESINYGKSINTSATQKIPEPAQLQRKNDSDEWVKINKDNQKNFNVTHAIKNPHLDSMPTPPLYPRSQNFQSNLQPYNSFLQQQNMGLLKSQQFPEARPKFEMRLDRETSFADNANIPIYPDDMHKYESSVGLFPLPHQGPAFPSEKKHELPSGTNLTKSMTNLHNSIVNVHTAYKQVAESVQNELEKPCIKSEHRAQSLESPNQIETPQLLISVKTNRHARKSRAANLPYVFGIKFTDFQPVTVEPKHEQTYQSYAVEEAVEGLDPDETLDENEERIADRSLDYEDNVMAETNERQSFQQQLSPHILQPIQVFVGENPEKSKQFQLLPDIDVLEEE